jgi:hypothetical protein
MFERKVEFFPIVAGIDKIEPILTAKNSNQNGLFKNEDFSIKSCPGIRDLLNLGYVIPLWQDIKLTFDDNNGLGVFPSGTLVDHRGNPFEDIQFHDSRSFAGYSFGDQYVDFSMKLRCPWYIRTPNKTKILMTPAYYRENPHFTIAPGIIETDKYPMLLVQIILKKFKGTVILKKGTPLAQIICINDQPEASIYQDDSKILKKVYEVKNWIYSKMHPASQYNNLDKVKK